MLPFDCGVSGYRVDRVSSIPQAEMRSLGQGRGGADGRLGSRVALHGEGKNQLKTQLFSRLRSGRSSDLIGDNHDSSCRLSKCLVSLTGWWMEAPFLMF